MIEKQIQKLIKQAIVRERDRREYGVVGRVNPPGSDPAISVWSDSRPQHIYVRMRDGSLAEILNIGKGAVPARGNLPVQLIRMHNGELKLDGQVDSQLEGDEFQPDWTGNYPHPLTSHTDVQPYADNAGKVLLVNPGETGTLWSEIPPPDIGAEIADSTEHTVLTGTERFGIAASSVLKWVSYTTIQNTIKSYYDSVAATLTNKSIDASTNTLTNINTSALAADAVSNAKLANMAQSTIKGRQAGGGTGDPEDLTPAQAMAIIKATQLLADAGFNFIVDGTNGLITRNTIATGGSLRNMLDMRIISSGSVSDGFGPSLFFSMNDAETAGDNFLGSFGYGRDGADNNGKLVIRNYVAGISTVAGEINSALNWGIGPLTSTLARLHIFQNVLGALSMRLQSSSAGDDPTLDTYQNRITTTDATPTTLHTFPIPANNTVYIKAVVIARRTGGSAGTADDGACYLLNRAYTTKAGTVTLLGTLENIQLEDVAAYNCALVISGTNVIVQVTGVANTNITWHLVEGEISPVGS